MLQLEKLKIQASQAQEHFFAAAAYNAQLNKELADTLSAAIQAQADLVEVEEFFNLHSRLCHSLELVKARVRETSMYLGLYTYVARQTAYDLPAADLDKAWTSIVKAA